MAGRNKIEIVEHSHAAMANAYEAGAAGLPCAIFRGYHRHRPAEGESQHQTRRHARSPARSWPLFRRTGPDVAVIHAQRADKAGNVMIEGIVGVQKEAVLASKRSMVTVEEIVNDFGPRSLNAVVLPHWTVGPIVEVPGGAFPSYAQGYY